MSAARTRHIPLRRCAVCRSSLPKSELIRFARDEEGQWRLDRNRRAVGRGTWVCKQERCHDRKALGRAFRAQSAQVAEQLQEFGIPAQEQETKKTSQDGGIDV